MNRRTTVLILSPILALVVCLAILFYPKSDDVNGLDTISVGYMKISDCVPLLNAEVFAKHGIELDLQPARGGSVILGSVIGGGLDLGYSNLVSPILANSEGNSLVVFGACSVENPKKPAHQIVTTSTSEIKSGGDLKGKRVAVNTLRNIDHLMLLGWLHSNGLTANDVSLVEVPFPHMVSVLEKGDVDAAAVVEPFVTMAKLAGHRLLGTYYVGANGNGTDVAAYAAKESWFKKNASLAARFETALHESVEFYTNNTEDFRQSIMKATKLKPQVVDAMPLPTLTASPTKEGIAHLIERLQIEGFLARDQDVSIDSILPLIK